MVDSAHTVHSDMLEHTGSMITFCTGVIDQKASSQKMNTLSSIECEQVGTSEYRSKIFFNILPEVKVTSYDLILCVRTTLPKSSCSRTEEIHAPGIRNILR